MIKTTTQNELILSIYKETGGNAQEEFQTECILNSLIGEERDDLKEMKDALDQLSFQPRQKSIDAILKYSASFMCGQ